MRVLAVNEKYLRGTWRCWSRDILEDWHVLVGPSLLLRLLFQSTPLLCRFDPYWWEGGIPRNVTIRNNYILDTPYNLPGQQSNPMEV